MFEIPPQEMSRMQAVMHFFDLRTVDEKKEYVKLAVEDRVELAKELAKIGYKIKPE